MFSFGWQQRVETEVPVREKEFHPVQAPQTSVLPCLWVDASVGTWAWSVLMGVVMLLSCVLFCFSHFLASKLPTKDTVPPVAPSDPVWQNGAATACLGWLEIEFCFCTRACCEREQMKNGFSKEVWCWETMHLCFRLKAAESGIWATWLSS